MDKTLYNGNKSDRSCFNQQKKIIRN